MIRSKLSIGMLLLAGLGFVCPMSRAQTDMAASIYGAFNGATNGNGIQQSPSNSAGILLELRHISNPLVGYEATQSRQPVLHRAGAALPGEYSVRAIEPLRSGGCA
ncbi:MAG: hypothetical protein ACLGPM_08070 [Acidobacteriota bacterium]